MTESPDAAALGAFLRRASRRVAVLAACRGAAVGLVIAGSVLLALSIGEFSGLMWTAVLGVAAIAGAAVGMLTAGRARQNIAALVEREAPACRNVVITGAEILANPDRVRPYIGERVWREAAALVRGLDLRRLFPARRTVLLVIAGVAVSSAAVFVSSRRPGTGATGPSSETAAAIAGIEIVVTPPSYTGQPARTLIDPASIVAIAGSRLGIRVEADAAAVTLETLGGRVLLNSQGSRRFAGDLIADTDGFVAFEPTASSGRAGTRRLIGLSVTPDGAPQVRMTAPGRDMLLPDAKRAFPISVEAVDDFGLTSLRVPYTKVTGTGENFTFASGEIQIDLSKPAGASWSGRGTLRLDTLGLEPGDMVIYRGVATDARPGATPAESDTFIVEIAAPGALLGEGFAIDDRQDRYAISQQMVIVKTERLIAARSKMPAADVAEAALDLAAEQRQVRAEFVFMMGGELADAGLDPGVLNEVAETELEDDLAAGRLVNQGRADLIRAIRAMSRATGLLNDRELTRALDYEKSALASLQRAFSRSRYILRTLGERERLDLSRRLTGVLAALARDSRPAIEAPPNPRAVTLRRALADLAALFAGVETGEAAATRATAIAGRLLRIDPGSEPLRVVAGQVVDIAGHFSARREATARTAIDAAAVALAAIARAELSTGPSQTPAPGLGQLDGALADALRQMGRSR